MFKILLVLISVYVWMVLGVILIDILDNKIASGRLLPHLQKFPVFPGCMFGAFLLIWPLTILFLLCMYVVSRLTTEDNNNG